MPRSDWETWKSVFTISGRSPAYWHLERASTEGVCWCECERALVAVPGQLDCPWCGCGWLFSCAQCGKAFTYAKPVRINQPLEEIVRRDLEGRGWKHNDEQIQDGVDYLRSQPQSIQPDAIYVYLDGCMLPRDSRDVRFKGWHAKHDFERLPHAIEQEQPGALDRILGDGKYWFDRKNPEQDDS